MNLKATLTNLKIAPRKVRLVVDLVRGKTVDEAERILTFASKRAAIPILKLVKSAAANAQHNFQLSKDRLMIKSITATDGATLKRYRPRAHGRAMTIHKRWSNVNLELGERAKSAEVSEKQKVANKESGVKSSQPKDTNLKTVTDVKEVKKITAKPSLNLHEQEKGSDHVGPTAQHGEKPQFKQRKTGAE